MKYLITGLGNPGSEYAHTRHNIGFDVVDAFAKKHNAVFAPNRHADYVDFSLKGRQIHLIKPTTYMNLSGKAVRYHMQELSIKPENMLVVVDDLAIDFGKLRLRPGGSDAGHNGLKSINEVLATQSYPRLRFGIGNNFAKGKQVDFVLSKWNVDEEKNLPELIDKAVNAIETYVLRGLQASMGEFNK